MGKPSRIDKSKGGSASKKMVQLPFDELTAALADNSLAAPKVFENILKLVNYHGLEPDYIERAAKMLAEYIENASVYKRRKLAQRISKLETATKIMLIREIVKLGITNFPIDICMSYPSRKGKIIDGVFKFQKKPAPRAMAFGSNVNCRLGIGSAIEKVENLTPVEIKGEIEKVHLGQNHTIFEMMNGDVYACGKEANFLEFANGSDKLLETPVQLPYFTANPVVPPTLIITDDSTKIINFTQCTSLIMGQRQPSEQETIRSQGDNWKIIKKASLLESKVELRKASEKHLEVDTYTGEKRKVTVCEDGQWQSKNGPVEMAFIADGFRIDSDKIWKSYTVCSNGTIYAIMDGNIYKGKLTLVPRAKPKYWDDTSSDEEDEHDGGQIKDDDVIFLSKDDILLAVLEELIMPHSFDGLAVSDDGESFIAWSNTDKNGTPDSFEKFRPTEMYPTKSHVYTEAIPKGTCDFLGLRQLFEETVSIQKTGEIRFYDTGVPMSIALFRTLLTLQHFLQIDEETQQPANLVKNVNKNNKLNLDAVTDALNSAIKEGHKVPVMSSIIAFLDPKNRLDPNNRLRALETKGRDYVAQLLKNVQQLLKKLDELPLKYRSENLETEFARFVEYLIKLQNGGQQTLNHPNITRQPSRTFNRLNCEEALQERITNRDIREGENSRLKLIRVEAVTFIETNEERDYLSRGCSPHDYYFINTTRFHIECLAPKLIPLIDENDVLNLNKICINDEDPTRFRKLVDSFFLLQDSFEHLSTYQRIIDIEATAKRIPATDTYTIETLNGVKVTVPKVLFEVFSPFDAGRRRHAVNGEENPDTFELHFSAEALKLALAVLVDVRVFFRAPMELKIEVYEICRYCIFTQVRQELLRMIVLTATEEHHNYISDLLWEEPDELIEMIANNRPDMIIFWKNLPIRQNYLPIFNKIAMKMNLRQYKKHLLTPKDVKMPIIAMKDEWVDSEKINQKFMKRHLSNHNDGDVQWELMKTILSWDVENPNRRKRTYDERNRMRM